MRRAHAQTAVSLPLSGCPRSRKACSTRAREWPARPGPPPAGSRRDTARGSHPRRPGAHFWSCGTSPCTSPTRTAVPVRVRRESKRRARPHKVRDATRIPASDDGHEPRSVARHRRQRERSGHEHDEERQAIHAHDTRDLRDGQNGRLRVPDQSPRGSHRTAACARVRSPPMRLVPVGARALPNRRIAPAIAAANAAGKSDR